MTTVWQDASRAASNIACVYETNDAKQEHAKRDNRMDDVPGREALIGEFQLSHDNLLSELPKGSFLKRAYLYTDRRRPDNSDSLNATCQIQ